MTADMDPNPNRNRYAELVELPEAGLLYLAMCFLSAHPEEYQYELDFWKTSRAARGLPTTGVTAR